MSYPRVPEVAEVAEQFRRAVLQSNRKDQPYRHWTLREVFPESLLTGILTLPIAPPVLGRTDGTRNTYNDQRCFITPTLRQKFPTCQVLAEALQTPAVARAMVETCGIVADGSFLRMEYIQDTDGAWLEPHRDIPEKLFSMVIYFFLGPDAKEWGTDIYDDEKRWIGRSAGEFNTGTIFIAGPNTWHGFDLRPIVGVRRLMEINYVHPSWRDRNQLSDPDRPISTK